MSQAFLSCRTETQCPLNNYSLFPSPSLHLVTTLDFLFLLLLLLPTPFSSVNLIFLWLANLIYSNSLRAQHVIRAHTAYDRIFTCLIFCGGTLFWGRATPSTSQGSLLVVSRGPYCSIKDQTWVGSGKAKGLPPPPLHFAAFTFPQSLNTTPLYVYTTKSLSIHSQRGM